MSESRDEATGQFTAEEPLYGHAGIEHEAGYEPMPDEPDQHPDELTVQQGADELTQGRMAESKITTYSALDGLDDNVTMTLEQGAKALDDSRTADDAQAELDQIAKIQKEVDELRGVKPEAKTETPEAEAQPVKDGELDPEIERALNNPKIKEAIAAQISETETARQSHLAAVTAATQIAQAAFLMQYPEFANVPQEQHANVLAAIQQHNPGRYAQIASTVERSAELFRQQGIAQQQEEQAKQAAFQSYARTQSESFERMPGVKGVSRSERAAIQDGIVAKIKEYGGDPAQFVKLMQASEFSNATVQRLLWDVGRLHRIENAPKAVAAKPLPPVQRPGVSTSRTGREENVQALDRRLSASGNIKDAVAMLTAQRRARG